MNIVNNAGSDSELRRTTRRVRVLVGAADETADADTPARSTGIKRNKPQSAFKHSSTEIVRDQSKKMKTDSDDAKMTAETHDSLDDLGKKGKKGKKDKHNKSPEGPAKSSKASSFVRKLNLSKYMPSPSGARRLEPVRSVSVEFESDASDKQSTASASGSGGPNLTPTSAKRRSPEADTPGSEMSAADTDDIGSRSTVSEEGGSASTPADSQETSVSGSHQRLHEPVSTKPYAISSWKDINPGKADKNTVQSRDEPTRKRIVWVSQLSEDKEEFMEESPAGNIDQITVRRHSGGDEIRSERAKAESLSILKVQDRKADSAKEEASTSHSSLPGTEEERTESAEETDAGGAGATSAMPAFGDLIMDAANSDRAQITSNLTQSGLERKEHLYKILVIGELGTGKTSIIKRYVHQFFSQHYRATIGVDFALKVLNWDANTIIRLQLWDIAGQERFGNMTRVYYKDAVGAFIVFDVTRIATFDAVVKWKQDLDSKVQLPDGSPIPCVLLGNKCDQQKEGIINTPSRMDEFCKEKGFSGWFETSAKENINIEEAARFLVNKILLNDKLLHSSEAAKDNEKISIDGKGLNGEKVKASGKTCSC